MRPIRLEVGERVKLVKERVIRPRQPEEIRKILFGDRGVEEKIIGDEQVSVAIYSRERLSSVIDKPIEMVR